MTSLGSKKLISAEIFVLMAMAAFSQTKEIQSPNLKELDLFNRSLIVIQDGPRAGVRLDEKEGEGVAWFRNILFSNGTLEFDVKGKDVQGQSFVGLAFHGQDNKTYDAIYLRPFNFKQADKIRRSHGVQYISHPVYTWSKLREESPGKYEQPVEPAPDPNSWVHVRVLVANPKISVYINNNGQPSLTVEKLSQRTNGSIGFWVGNGSGGDFSNLKITPGK
jgi:hypothetical protein